MGGGAGGTVVVGDVKTGDGLAYLTLGATKSITTDIFNNWGPEEGGLSNDYPTHLLYSPEDYSTSRSTETNSAELPITKKTIQPLGGRIPIILVHGWQGDAGKTKPQSQMTKELSADNYWNNLIQFFQNNATLKSKYKLYVYKYPSYKHVTFNALKLRYLLDAMLDLKNAQQMSFIGHSMGTIVVRSLFEEHDFDHNRVQKIIMLDGVHHGSPAAVPGLVYLDTNVLAGKDLYTLGSNDIQWDNYDNIYNAKSIPKFLIYAGNTSNTFPINKLVFNIMFDYSILPVTDRISFSFSPVKNIASSSNSLENQLMPKADEQVVNFYCVPNPSVQKQCIRRPENSSFDTWYRKRIINLMIDNPKISLPSIKNGSDVNSYMYGTVTEQATLGYGSTLKVGNLPLVPNPWLAYLNLKHQTMPVSYQNKMYLYAAVNMPATEDKNHDGTTDLIKFNVASNGVKNLGAFERDSFGYWNDGPVPLTGSLMDMSKSFDEWVSLSGVNGSSSTIITPYNSWIFGSATSNSGGPIGTGGSSPTFAKYGPGSWGYEGNGYAKHRLFMDYNHDRMLNGCYYSTPDDLLNNSSKTCWKNSVNGKYIDRVTYAMYASDKNKGSIFPSNLSTALAGEPLFLAIQQDLNPPTDTNSKLDCIFNTLERLAPTLFSVADSSPSAKILTGEPSEPFYRIYANGNLVGGYKNQLYLPGKAIGASTNDATPLPGTIDFWAGKTGCTP